MANYFPVQKSVKKSTIVGNNSKKTAVMLAETIAPPPSPSQPTGKVCGISNFCPTTPPPLFLLPSILFPSPFNIPFPFHLPHLNLSLFTFYLISQTPTLHLPLMPFCCHPLLLIPSWLSSFSFFPFPFPFYLLLPIFHFPLFPFPLPFLNSLSLLI